MIKGLGFKDFNYTLSIVNYKLNKCRGVEQLVARRAHNPKVVGSNPSPATKNQWRMEK